MTVGSRGGTPATDSRRSRLVGPAVAALLAVAVVAFTAGRPGDLVLNGPGSALYLRVGLDHLGQSSRGYWFPERWGGFPVFAVIPSVPVPTGLPPGLGGRPRRPVKIAVLAFQILGAMGAYLLAHSLWSRTEPAVVAALVYGLHAWSSPTACSAGSRGPGPGGSCGRAVETELAQRGGRGLDEFSQLAECGHGGLPQHLSMSGT